MLFSQEKKSKRAALNARAGLCHKWGLVLTGFLLDYRIYHMVYVLQPNSVDILFLHRDMLWVYIRSAPYVLWKIFYRKSIYLNTHFRSSRAMFPCLLILPSKPVKYHTCLKHSDASTIYSTYPKI